MGRTERAITMWLCTWMVGCLFFMPAAYGEKYHTPLAGEAYHTELFGRQVDVPARDRRHVTAANFGVQWIPNGPSQLELLPFGALYVWRNQNDGHRRFRGTFSGVVNDINYNLGSKSLRGWELVFTLDNFILPLGRSEYVEGQRIQDVEVQWNYIFAGVGIGYRRLLPPGHQDNALEISLTYEPGYRWFARSKGTSPNFIVPTDTYEGRIRFRVRADALDRNLMELPHRGYSIGGDALYGHRARWGNWGGGVFDSPDVQRERNYQAISAYAVAAGGVPFIDSERHRLISSFYGGIGKDLDRFTAFRLPGRPTGYEWEALSLPVMPAVAFNELFPRRYAIADLIYRYEALFFLYPYIRGTYGLVERPRFVGNGAVRNQMDGLPALGGGIISGAPWRSQIELNYSYNFGIFRDPGGKISQGGHGFFALWSKEL
ncbi:MAG TPA: hypothetical protein VJ692_11905 [Nitrospiraceae bacterium]|nr:hypothetical protein [Nitrospiraceae bacterium]